jgi:hypothetical protein
MKNARRMLMRPALWVVAVCLTSIGCQEANPLAAREGLPQELADARERMSSLRPGAAQSKSMPASKPAGANMAIISTSSALTDVLLHMEYLAVVMTGSSTYIGTAWLGNPAHTTVFYAGKVNLLAHGLVNTSNFFFYNKTIYDFRSGTGSGVVATRSYGNKCGRNSKRYMIDVEFLSSADWIEPVTNDMYIWRTIKAKQYDECLPESEAECYEGDEMRKTKLLGAQNASNSKKATFFLADDCDVDETTVDNSDGTYNPNEVPTGEPAPGCWWARDFRIVYDENWEEVDRYWTSGWYQECEAQASVSIGDRPGNTVPVDIIASGGMRDGRATALLYGNKGDTVTIMVDTTQATQADVSLELTRAARRPQATADRGVVFGSRILRPSSEALRRANADARGAELLEKLKRSGSFDGSFGQSARKVSINLPRAN